MNRPLAAAVLGCSALLFTTIGYVVAQQTPATPPSPRVKETVLVSIDLGLHFESMRGKQMKMSYAVIDPHAVGSVHSHKGWPEVVYVIKGTLVEHQGTASREYHAGEAFASNADLTVPHNIENRSDQPTEVVLVEIPIK